MAADKQTFMSGQNNDMHLVRKYDRWYIRFLGEDGEDEVCDLPISMDDAYMLLQGKANILQIKEKYEQQYQWSLEDYVDNAIAEEMRYIHHYTAAEIKKKLALLNQHKGIKVECYDAIITHRFPKYNYIIVQGKTAQWLHENLELSVLDAYLYMSISLYRSKKKKSGAA